MPLTALETLEAAGYTPFTYQIDATRQALSVLETHNGAILADVVGLGKQPSRAESSLLRGNWAR